MAAEVIDGKALSERARSEVARRAAACALAGLRPRLDALLVSAGDNAARVYAENQSRTCAAVGVEYVLHEVPGDSGQAAIEDRIRALNADTAVHAVMLHLPLPEGVDAYGVQRLLDPEKDAENVTPTNIGDVVYGRSQRAPCTALAAVRLVESTGVPLVGARCVVVGAGPVVGRPIAALLMQREATVISANKFTWGLEDLCRSAEVLIPAAGVPGLVTASMVRPGAVVVDVGINRIAGPDGRMRTVGDCVPEEVARVAGHLSPVPGGVGPMTVAMLLTNVVEAAERRVSRLP